MSDIGSVLAGAIADHKAGRLTEAEAGYRRVLREQPANPKALYYAGLLHFHRGEADTALKLVAQALEHAPSNAQVWNTFGGMLIAAARPAQAREAYRRATQAGPTMAEAWYNFGICLRNEGDVDAAVAALREAIARDPDYFQAYGALATLLYQLGRSGEAAEIYTRWADRDPENAYARHMAAAATGTNVPSRASDEYIRTHFDRFAGEFDEALERLHYRAPELIAAELARCATPGRPLDVLDAGCGTGLCAPLIRSLCRRLVGVDLSEKMIDRARARGGYDELLVAELGTFMRSRPGAFDAIVSADTFVYFGALDEPLRAACESLRTAGALIFTLEALEAEADGDAGHRLEAHGRYAHGEAYVRSALAAAGFELTALSREVLREEQQRPVPGYVVRARRR